MDKKIALITGASRGLGAALAEELCATHHIVAVARTTGALEELDDRIKARGGEATLAPMDITNADAMAHLCRSIYDRWGRADTWVHTAIHAAPLTPATHLDKKDWTKSVDVNVTATGILIPMIGALLGFSPTPMALFFDDPHAGEKFFSSYGATKAAQISLARSWEAEMVQGGTVVRVLTPAPMPTAVRARFYPGEDRAALTPCASEAKRLLKSL